MKKEHYISFAIMFLAVAIGIIAANYGQKKIDKMVA
jgi:hypothetical protein